jgi:Spy/CpxP family protein refolding chaperone
MVSIRKLVLTVGALALVASPALAQQQKGRGGFGGMGGIFMLTQEPVQKELKFTDEQKSKAQDAVTAARQAHMDELAALRDAPQEERAAKGTALNKTMTAEVVKALGLNEEQLKRFHQINIQAMRAQAFAMPEVQEKLKLTDEQKTQLREIASSARTQATEILKNAGDNREEARTQTVQLNKETTEKIMAILKDDQKAAWKELIGAPFEYTPVFRRRNN